MSENKFINRFSLLKERCVIRIFDFSPESSYSENVCLTLNQQKRRIASIRNPQEYSGFGDRIRYRIGSNSGKIYIYKGKI